MIDIHSHLVFDVDDGSASIEESVNIIKQAIENGVEAIVATPHYLEPTYVSSKEENLKKINEIKSKLLEDGINDFEIYLGNEVYITTEVLKLIKENKISKLNDSKYLLIEFPLQEEPLFIDEVLFKLLSFGITPIIAHPERYAYVKKGYNFLGNLLDKGCLLQVNACSILGQYGSKAQKLVKTLLKYDMVSFIASDNHKENNIYPKFDEAFKKIEKIIGEEKLDELIDINPRKVIANQDIIINEY